MDTNQATTDMTNRASHQQHKQEPAQGSSKAMGRANRTDDKAH